MGIMKRLAIGAAGFVALSVMFIGGFAASEQTRHLSRAEDTLLGDVRDKCNAFEGGCALVPAPVLQQLIEQAHSHGA